MSNLDIVEEYVKNHKNRFKKLLFIQFVTDSIEIAVLVFACLKTMDNKNLFLIITAIILVIMMSTIMINIKIVFGSLKKLSESSSIGREYLNAKNALNKCSADDNKYSELNANFEQTINTLAEKIKAMDS